MSAALFDVTVVGGGPAGARLAWRLAVAGARVALADGSHPREKPCGGGVTGRALALIAKQLEGACLDGVAVTRARFADERGRAEVALHAGGCTPASSLLVVGRAMFDRVLLERAVAAGAAHFASRVRDVSANGRGCVAVLESGETVRSRALAGADGPASLVRRRLAQPFERAALSVASGFFVHGVTGDAIDVEFVADPPGYLWSFPRPDHLAVGVCAQADRSSSPALRESAARWIERQRFPAGARLQPYSWPIPSLTVTQIGRERPAAGRWLLVGDAAGLVDPITREGIYFALRSADLAADALAAGGDPSAGYADRLGDEIFPELRRAAALKAGFFRRRFTGLLIDALSSSRTVGEIMADLIAGRQPYRTLVPRLLSTLELRLAWQLARLRLSAWRE